MQIREESLRKIDEQVFTGWSRKDEVRSLRKSNSVGFKSLRARGDRTVSGQNRAQILSHSEKSQLWIE